jgi:hypothetical protein
METNKEPAKRDNADKLDWTQLDFKALEAAIRVQSWGNKKYGRDNWRNGMTNNTILQSMTRHVVALNKGEMIDGDTKESHAAHILLNAMYWLHYNKNYDQTANIKEALTENTYE